jgi:hypothetical protein
MPKDIHYLTAYFKSNIPIKVYIRFMDLHVLNKKIINNTNRQFFNRIIINLEAECTQNSHHFYSQPTLILLSNLIDNYQNEYDLIIRLIKFVLHNINKHDKTKKKYDQEQLLYKNLTKIVENWLVVKRSNASLLVNYGLDDQQQPSLNNCDEFQIYNIFLYMLNPFMSKKQSVFPLFSKDLFYLFEQRVASSLNNGFDELIEFRLRFNFEEKFKFKSKLFESIVDRVIIARLTEYLNVDEFENLCNKLYNTKKSLVKNYVEQLLKKIWPKNFDDWLQFLLSQPIVLAIYKYNIINKYYTNPLGLLDKNTHDDSLSLINNSFNIKYINIFKQFGDVLDAIVSGKVIIKDLEIVYDNLNQAKKIIEFLTIHLNWNIKYLPKHFNIDKLMLIRLAELNELGKFFYITILD